VLKGNLRLVSVCMFMYVCACVCNFEVHYTTLVCALDVCVRVSVCVSEEEECNFLDEYCVV
jgi:hypothetical protein